MYQFRLFHIEKIIPFGNLRKGSKCPKSRSGHRIIADNGDVYSFGGYNPLESEHDDDEVQPNQGEPPYPLFRELWKFNLASRTWIKLKPVGFMPEELASHTAALVNNTLLVFGGTGVPFGASSSNKIHLCGLNRLEWQQLQTVGDVPLQQYGQAATVKGKHFYVVGGTTGHVYSIDVHRLNLETKCWERLPASAKPKERYRHEIVIKDKKIYVLGGGTANVCFTLKCIPVYDINKLEWEKVKTYPDLNEPKGYPVARRCHGSVHYDAFVYISGGHDGSSALNDLWQLNLNSMQWTKLRESLHRPVHFHSSTLSPNGQMLIFGGVTRFNNNDMRINDMYSMWIKVPSLKEMSWLAVCHYNPLIAENPREKLHGAGIPKQFLNRVDFVNSTTCNPDTAALIPAPISSFA